MLYYKGTIKILLFSFTLAMIGCNEEFNLKNNNIVVVSPRQNELFFKGDSITVSGKILEFENINEVNIEIGNQLTTVTSPIFSIKLASDELPGGAHSVIVWALNQQNQRYELATPIRIIEKQIESKNLETFSDNNIDGYEFQNWNLELSMGHDDSFSLRSFSEQGMVVTQKTFLAEGNVSFFLSGGKDSLEFYINERLISNYFKHSDWTHYSFYVHAGKNTFKWKSKGENIYLDQISFEEGIVKHSLGERFSGGIVFYLDSTGQHGLVAANDDARFESGPTIPWGCYGLQITSGNKANSKSDGLANTIAVITDCHEEEIAVKACYYYPNGQVHSGWYLPAIDELKLLFANRHIVGNMESNIYWSSTTISKEGARVYNFIDSTDHGANRSIPFIQGPAPSIYARAVKAF